MVLARRVVVFTPHVGACEANRVRSADGIPQILVLADKYQVQY
jgi:hypothetical protein